MNNVKIDVTQQLFYPIVLLRTVRSAVTAIAELLVSIAAHFAFYIIHNVELSGLQMCSIKLCSVLL